jgi:hypothetical protein
MDVDTGTFMAITDRLEANEAQVRYITAAMQEACTAAGIPVPEPEAPRLGLIPAGLTARLDALEAGLVQAYHAARWPVPEGVRPRSRPRQRRVVRGDR